MTNLVLGGPYETPSKKLRVGRLYTRTWQAPMVRGVTAIWEQRIRDYWSRVEQRFGIAVSEPRNVFDGDLGTITTFATVLGVLKGDRYPARQSEAVH